MARARARINPLSTHATHSRPTMSSTSWCFTLNNPVTPTNPWAKPINQGIIYAIWQLEIGTQCGTIHIQGYLESSKKQRISYVRKIIPTAHWEKRAGTREQARLYCMKEDTRLPLYLHFLPEDTPSSMGPFEYGEFSPSLGSGTRTDLIHAGEKLHQISRGSTTMDKIREDEPSLWRWKNGSVDLLFTDEKGEPVFSFSAESQTPANLLTAGGSGLAPTTRLTSSSPQTIPLIASGIQM